MSFCPVPDSTTIIDGFTNLESCRKFTVEATGRLETGTLELPAENETSKVLMEVITQGIKADFKATMIAFHGNCTAAMTTSKSITLSGSSSTIKHKAKLVLRREQTKLGW